MASKDTKDRNTPYQSLKEFWSDPVRNRRVVPGGRRQADSAVCMFHDIQSEETEKHRENVCGSIAKLESDVCRRIEEIKVAHEKDDEVIHTRITRMGDKMIGKWPFSIIVVVFMLAVGLISLNNSFILDNMRSDIEKLKEATYAIKKNVTNGS